MAKVNLQTHESGMKAFLGSLADQAKAKGILSLPDRFDETDDDFIKYAIQLLCDGFPPEQVNAALQKNIEERAAAFRKNLSLVATTIDGIQQAKDPAVIRQELESL